MARSVWDRLKGTFAKDQADALSFDREGITRRLRSGQVEYLAWRDMVEIRIVTIGTDRYVEQCVFVLHGRDGSGCVIPLDLAVNQGLLDRLRFLPGFDGRKLAEASRSPSHADVVCWRAEGWTGEASE